jgi:hypothetical protein
MRTHEYEDPEHGSGEASPDDHHGIPDDVLHGAPLRLERAASLRVRIMQ